MIEENVTLTDPARELAELCAQLQGADGISGEQYLSKKFEVPAWSPQFFQILFTIVERCNLLKTIVADLEMDSDIKEEIKGHINRIIMAFSADSMKQGWSSYGNLRVSEGNINSVKAISGLVRQKVAYRKLSDIEVREVDDHVAILLQWLNEHQISERDFIRQALIEGLAHFRFRLAHLRWLGWGFTLDALRDVIAAYMLLERTGVDPVVNPDAAAILLKVAASMKVIYEKVTATKKASDAAEWVIKLYGAGSLIYQGGKPFVAALIGN